MAKTYIITERQLKLYINQVIEEKLNENAMPSITIETNDEENNFISAIQRAQTDEEKRGMIKKFQKYYINFFLQNYANKSVINKSSGVKVELVRTGIEHSLRYAENYYLWPVIRYLSNIIEIASYKTEISQHINEPNTNRGDNVHIFNCKGIYIFRNGTEEKKEIHDLRISAVTYKKRPEVNFRHISNKINENQNGIINAKLVSIEIQ